MAKLSTEEIHNIRKKHKRKLSMRLLDKNRFKVFVHMDETEILSGAKPVVQAFQKELKKYNISNVILKQIAEEKKYKTKPFVEIYVPNGDVLQYKEVEPDIVPEIVEKIFAFDHKELTV